MPYTEVTSATCLPGVVQVNIGASLDPLATGAGALDWRRTAAPRAVLDTVHTVHTVNYTLYTVRYVMPTYKLYNCTGRGTGVLNFRKKYFFFKIPDLAHRPIVAKNRR